MTCQTLWHLFCVFCALTPCRKTQAFLQTIANAAHTAFQSLRRASLTLRERSGISIVVQQEVGFCGGEEVRGEGVSKEAVDGFGGGGAIGGGGGEGDGGVVVDGVFGIDRESVGILQAGDDAQETVEEGAANFFHAM